MTSGKAEGHLTSLQRLSQDKLVERQIRDRPLQSRILLLKLLQAPCVRYRHAPLLFSPTVVDLLRNLQLSAHELHILTLRQMNLCLPKYPDDLLHRKTLPLHPDLLSGTDSGTKLTQNPDQFLGVRSVPKKHHKKMRAKALASGRSSHASFPSAGRREVCAFALIWECGCAH